MTGKVISFCNRKGGVGKTTATVCIADTLQSQFAKSVVVVDTDPQASSTIAYLGRPQHSDAVQKKYLEETLRSGLLDGRQKGSPDVAVDGVARFTDRPGVPMALVPISPKFWPFEHSVRKEVSFFSTSRTAAVRRFKRLLETLKKEYDFVLVDTAPGVSMLFDHIVRASDELVIPCVPDDISVWGLSVLRDELARIRGRHPAKLRILWTQFNPSSKWQEIVKTLDRAAFESFERNQGAELVGIGQYVDLPRAMTNPSPCRWSSAYPDRLADNLLRICEMVQAETTE